MRYFFLNFIIPFVIATVTMSGLAPGARALETLPVVQTDNASSVTGQSAVLNGTVNPGSNLTMYYFQYGTDTGYGNTTELRSAGLGSDAVSVNETITGLMEGTPYHFRLVAFNINGNVNGSDIGFSTCKIKIPALTITGTRVVNMPVTVSLTGMDSCSSTLYYRFSMHPGYGTDDYTGRNWQQMTDTEWVSTRTVNYTFENAGKYIVVVWIADINSSVNASGIPIIGFSIDIAESTPDAADARIDLTGCSISGVQEVGSPVTLGINAQSGSSDPISFRFSMHPDYGTVDYTGKNWQQMTDTEWVSTSSIDYAFADPGKYVVVVWMTQDTGNVTPTGIPIAGFSVNVDQTGEAPSFQ